MTVRDVGLVLLWLAVVGGLIVVELAVSPWLTFAAVIAYAGCLVAVLLRNEAR